MAEEREKKKKTSVLNGDIMYDIFTRLPSYLLEERFRYQCKEWFNIISSQSLTEEHLRNGKAGIITAERDDTTNTCTMHFTEFNRLENFKVRDLIKIKYKNGDNVEIVSSCNGLLLVRHGLVQEPPTHRPVFYVVNPLTKERIRLPPSPSLHSWCELVFLPSTEEYKVVHLYLDTDKRTSIFYIQTLDDENSTWRRVDVPRRCTYNFMCGRTSINGVLYLVDEGTCNIVSLDVSNGSVGRVSYLPAVVDEEDIDDIKLSDLNGHLCIAYGSSSGEVLSVWTLNDYDSGKWTRIIRIQDEGACDLSVIGSLSNGELIVFRSAYDEFIRIYDVKNKVFSIDIKEKEVSGNCWRSPLIHVNNLLHVLKGLNNLCK